MQAFDVAIIGGGSAGYAAARTSIAEGLKTIVIEGGPQVGGLCILKGCMPSKALIESANRYRTLQRAEEFGLRATDLRVIPEEIVARKSRLIHEFAEYRQEQLESAKFEFLRGQAVFETKNRVRVDLLDGGQTMIEAKVFIIATGSIVQVPDIPGLKDIDFLTSNEALELMQLPKSMVVLGAGPVALELAHYFQSMGVDVSVIQRSNQVLKGIDVDVAQVVEQAFLKRGIKVFTETRIQSMQMDAAGTKTINFEHQGSLVEIKSDAVLNALGRTPNTQGLGLEEIGVALKKERIDVTHTMQTNVETIFAVGDVSGPFEVVHVAITQGEVAARNAARILGQRTKCKLEEMDYRLKLFAVFTDPEVGVVGMTEMDAERNDVAVAVATYPFDDHGKSLVMGETYGFVKLLMDLKTGEICGGAVVGPHASELIHEIVVAMAFHATPMQLAKVPHYHPTLSEIWTYPAEDLAEQWEKTKAI